MTGTAYRECFRSRSHGLQAALLLGAALLTAAAAPASAEPDTDESQRKNQEDRLEAARARLDDAAREVAELSATLADDETSDIITYGNSPRRAMLGLEIATGK